MEKQKLSVEDQAKRIQDRHTAMLKQQQMRSEILLKQIQTRLESEVKMKNEMVRHHINLLGDIRVPNTVADVGSSLMIENLGEDRYVLGMASLYEKENTII